MQYVVSRLAKKNPRIAGCRLYLMRCGAWTMVESEARKFDTMRDAQAHMRLDLETKIEVAK